MSQELSTRGHHEVSFTRYVGPKDENGDRIHLQLTASNCDGDVGYIGVPQSECLALALDLIDFYFDVLEEE